MSDRIAFAGSVTSEGRRIRGSVVLAGSRTFRNGEWVEVDPGALVKADASDAMARFDHEPNKVLGRMKNGTLSLIRTETGLDYEISPLPNVTYANDALVLVSGGYVGGSSFEIDGLKSTFSTDPDGTRVRRITSIKRLIDVSPVFDPAFPSSAAAFNKEKNMAENETPPPEPPEEPTEPAKYTASEMSRESAETFARERTTEQITAFMDSVMAATGGDMNDAQLDQYEGFATVLAERQKAASRKDDRVSRFKALHDMRIGRTPKAPSSDFTASEDYSEAFTQYLRTGNPRQVESFAQSIGGSGAEGGFTVPDGFLQRITERLKAFGGIAGVADEITTSTGESLRWPSNDDTSNTAAIAAEGVAGTAGADLTFGNLELGAFSYDANGTGNVPLKVSLELIQDSAFDIASFIGERLGERIGRKQASHLATGAGGTEPVGLLSKAADTMTATVVSLAAPEHIFQVDSAYRQLGNCRWVMSDTSLAKVWTAQATTNEPMFLPGRTINGQPFDSLYGYPITLDQAAGNLVAFGDIRRGYIIRRVRGVQLLVDPYTAQSTRQIAYHAWARMDAQVQDSFAYSVSTWASVTADT